MCTHNQALRLLDAELLMQVMMIHSCLENKQFLSVLYYKVWGSSVQRRNLNCQMPSPVSCDDISLSLSLDHQMFELDSARMTPAGPHLKRTFPLSFLPKLVWLIYNNNLHCPKAGNCQVFYLVAIWMIVRSHPIGATIMEIRQYHFILKIRAL